MKKWQSGLALAGALLIGASVIGTSAAAATSRMTPVPCTPLSLPGVGESLLMVPRPCPPLPTGPMKPTDSKPDGANDEVIPVEDAPRDGVRPRGDDIDDWMQAQVDLPLMQARGLFESVVLVQPSLLARPHRKTLLIWGSLLPIGVVLCLFAMANHSRHLLQGTDQVYRRSVAGRVTVPIICMGLMFLTPLLWETAQRIQEYAWAADGFDRRNADAVLGVVLPPAATVLPDGQVRYFPAGSITPVRHSLGILAGFATGLFLLGISLAGLAVFIITLILVGLSPLAIGISALSHEVSPLLGWVNIGVRTLLTTSIMNAAWFLMRNLPAMFDWTGMASVLLLPFLLAGTLASLYAFWLLPLKNQLVSLAGWARGSAEKGG